MNVLRVSLLSALTATVLLACSGSPKIESDLGIKGAPDWVNEGTQAVDNKNGRFIYGVASAPPLNDESLQTSTADNRARAEVARVVATYIDATLSDYSESTGDAASMSIEQTINSNIWSFVEMDMKALDDAIATSSKLSQGFKGYYSGNSGVNFDRFIKDAE